jgi:hypothetical protein
MAARFLSGFVVVLGLASGAVAQTTGNIEGRVTDSAGAPLEGVGIEATSPSLQGARSVSSGAGGDYRISGLPPGLYHIRAILPGLDPEERVATLSLDARARVDLSLRLSTSAAVQVRGETPPVDLASTTTGTNYTSAVVAHLPVTRNYADIVRANPGVLQDVGQTQGRSLALSIYGATSVENQWIIDGVNTTNVHRGMQGKAINNEFVQEVEVKTGGYQAEYGRALGGVINVITKAGGNTFHGDGFLYYDQRSFGAERVFVEGVDSPLGGMRVVDSQRFDFGASLGGYLIKDRLWFFGAYNRVESPSEVSRYMPSETVPTTMRFPSDVTDNLYSAKLTWNLASATTLVGTVFADPTTRSGAAGDVFSPEPGTWQSERFIGGTDFGLRLNQLFGSNILVTLQAARHQDRHELTPTGPAAAPLSTDFTCPGGTLDQPCDIPGEPNFVSGGYGLVVGADDHSSSYRNQFRGNGTVYLGGHELKLGGEYLESHTAALTFVSGGQIIDRYNELGQTYYSHTFFARAPDDLALVAGWDSRPRIHELGFFAQDTWRVAPDLTISAGLRWDQEDIRNSEDITIVRTTNEWQPRLGVVWDPRGDGTTKVYAFAGRFTYALPTDLAIFSAGNFTVAHTYNFDPSELFQDPLVLGHERPEVESNFFVAKEEGALRATSQDELTLGAEQLLGSLFFGLKGTYRRLANAIENRCDLDYYQNEGSTCAIINPGADEPYARGDFFYCDGLNASFETCGFGAPAPPPARRVYRGIELLVRDTISSRLWLQASYVFSSLRGNYDGGVSESFGWTDPGINPGEFDFPEEWHNGYGRLYLDRPHQFRFDGFYELPLGFSIGLQTWVRSGAPLNRFGYLHDFPGMIHLVPRGQAGRLPTEWDANLTLEYSIQFGPVMVTLQGYVYNLFNNQIRTGQDPAWTDSPPPDYPASLFDPDQPSNNADYGRVTQRQDPRLFRAALKLSF